MKHTSVKNKIRNKERTFSVELGAKEDLRTFSLSNDSRDNVLIEGTLGELINAGFREGTILEIAGRRGVLRIDLQEKELVDDRRGLDQVFQYRSIGIGESGEITLERDRGELGELGFNIISRCLLRRLRAGYSQ